DAPPGDGIQCVVPESLIKSVAQVQPPDVPAARPSQVAGADRVCQHTAVYNRTDGRRPHQKSVVVEMNAWIVTIEVKAEFVREAFLSEVLNVDVGDVY